MLRLQCAIVAIDDDLDHVVNEASVLIDSRLVVEALRNDSVKIAVLGMSKDNGVVVVVLYKELVEVQRRISQTLDGKGYIFDDDRGSGLAHRSYRREHAGADLPQQCLFGSNVGERGRFVQFESTDGVTREFKATVAEGEQRARIWREGLRIYPGWSQYERRASHRDIAVFVLGHSREERQGPAGAAAAIACSVVVDARVGSGRVG
jgi:hypothetical protein